MDGNAFQIVATDDSVEVKTCTFCGEEKPFDDFYADKTKRTGVRSRCKACTKPGNPTNTTDMIKEALENAAYRLLKERIL